MASGLSDQPKGPRGTGLASAAMELSMEEVAREGLTTAYSCCTRLQIPLELREAVAVTIGAPRGDFSIFQLQHLTQDERSYTVEGLRLSDGQQPPRPRPPSLFEKSLVRSLFTLADQVTVAVAARRHRCYEPLQRGQASGSAPAGQPGLPTVRMGGPEDWKQELPVPAMLYQPGGEHDGEAKVAFTKDPMGLARKAKPNRKQAMRQRLLRLSEGKRRKPSGCARRAKRAERKAAEGAAVEAASRIRSGQARRPPPPPPPPPPQPHPPREQSSHPQKRGGLFWTTREGVEVCYGFAKNGPGTCPDPCPLNRSHVCQICLGPHRNGACPQTESVTRVGVGGEGTQGTPFNVFGPRKTGE